MFQTIFSRLYTKSGQPQQLEPVSCWTTQLAQLLCHGIDMFLYGAIWTHMPLSAPFHLIGLVDPGIHFQLLTLLRL